MDNNQDTNLCYVFSPSTVEKAVQEWSDKKMKSEPEKDEEFQVFSAAVPWFLEHIQHDASIYMFTHEDLLAEIEIWKKVQLESYSNQKKRINKTCDLIMRFFESGVVKEHKMIIET